MSDTTFVTLESFEFASEDLRCICFAINTFGSGQHPMAQNNGLKFFGLDYVVGCLQEMLNDKHISRESKEHCHVILAVMRMDNE